MINDPVQPRQPSLSDDAMEIIEGAKLIKLNHASNPARAIVSGTLENLGIGFKNGGISQLLSLIDSFCRKDGEIEFETIEKNLLFKGSIGGTVSATSVLGKQTFDRQERRYVQIVLGSDGFVGPDTGIQLTFFYKQTTERGSSSQGDYPRILVRLPGDRQLFGEAFGKALRTSKIDPDAVLLNEESPEWIYVEPY